MPQADQWGLTLNGHSGRAIALKVGTALATAKAHSCNISAKLRFSALAHLFDAFPKLPLDRSN